MPLSEYLMKIFALQNSDGSIVISFPPRYGPDRIIHFFPYVAIVAIAKATDLKVVLMEVKVTFEPTGRVDSISGNPPRNIRSISM